MWKGGDQLRFFRADLHEEGSFEEAVKGCDGVFHVAASMQFNVNEKENIGNAMQCNALIIIKELNFNNVCALVTNRFLIFHLCIELVENFVQTNIIDPAIEGTVNLLKSCLKSNSVKRVVFTSSISTITAKDSNGKWKPIVDESCQIQTDTVWNTQPSGWVSNAFLSLLLLALFTKFKIDFLSFFFLVIGLCTFKASHRRSSI